MPINQSDIAKKLGVSRVTVTKALNDSPDISAETKHKVRQLAAELEYIPNLTARSLIAKRTKTIGVVIPDITSYYFSSIVRSIMFAAEKNDYHIILTASRENAQTEKDNILNLLSMNVDGLLVGVSLNTTDFSIFDRVKRRKKPLVFFARPSKYDGFSRVGFDDYKAAFDLTEYLIKKGKRAIAHITGNMNSDGRLRLEGYRSALKKHGIQCEDKWIVPGDYAPDFGYQGFENLYNSGDIPEVIFAANDAIAQGVYSAARDKGFSIPEDIGIVAIGHNKFAEILFPKLTIIDYPTDLIGAECTRLLFSEIEDRSNPEQNILLQARLIENDSV